MQYIIPFICLPIEKTFSYATIRIIPKSSNLIDNKRKNKKRSKENCFKTNLKLANNCYQIDDFDQCDPTTNKAEKIVFY